MYFSRLFLEKITDHAIIGCDSLVYVMERFKDLGEHDLECVYYYWMENVHKKWLPMLEGPALSMRQPDEEDAERDDPYIRHTIRNRALNFHNWVIASPMSRLLFTHLVNEVKPDDFENDINFGDGEDHTNHRCLGEPNNHDGTGATVPPETVGGFTAVPDQPLEDQTSAHLRLRVIKSLDPNLYHSLKTELLDLFRESVGVLLSTSFSPTRRYLSDVLVLGNGKERRKLLEWIEGNGATFPGQLYGFVEEASHVHVIHDCAYSNRSCRCKWRNHPGVRNSIKKPIRRPKYIGQFSWLDWFMLSYISLCQNGVAKKKFGLQEEYGDYRVDLKIYDRKHCEREPKTFWKGKEKEFSVTLSRRSPLMSMVNKLYLNVFEDLQKRGADLRNSASSHSFF
ncbi:uncharacterized protein TNCT_283511 [Trichonephila clavata]|uniref:Uncharacterized protein n=1 Tax=Trichonephila clavata TaxID=2740835 RepID=A0A8X6GXA8_TRICU|nr:uncharacterized protein TNCT_283511 [Trichonephila clavata]